MRLQVACPNLSSRVSLPLAKQALRDEDTGPKADRLAGSDEVCTRVEQRRGLKPLSTIYLLPPCCSPFVFTGQPPLHTREYSVLRTYFAELRAAHLRTLHSTLAACIRRRAQTRVGVKARLEKVGLVECLGCESMQGVACCLSAPWGQKRAGCKEQIPPSLFSLQSSLSLHRFITFFCSMFFRASSWSSVT